MRAHVSSKGQLVLPKEIREKRGILPGSEVDIEEVPGGILLRLVRGPQEVSLQDLIGCTGYRGPRKSLADMEEAIRKGARAGR